MARASRGASEHERSLPSTRCTCQTHVLLLSVGKNLYDETSMEQLIPLLHTLPRDRRLLLPDSSSSFKKVSWICG